MAQGNDAPAGTPAESASAEYDGPEDKILTLRKPLKLHDEDPNPITELHLTEPTAGQLSKFLKAQNKPGADDVEAGAIFISLNSGVSLKHCLELGARDLREALDFLSGFTPDTPVTGRT